MNPLDFIQDKLDQLQGKPVSPIPRKDVLNSKKKLDERTSIEKMHTLWSGAIKNLENSGRVSAEERVRPTIDPQVKGFLDKTVFPVTRKYGIPDAVAAGQFAAEGRLQGTGASRNNYFNYMGYDGQENAMPAFQTPQQGVEAYAKLLTTDPRYTKATQHRTDPRKFIMEVQNGGYAGDPMTYKQRASNGMNSYSDFIMSTPEWQYYSP